MDGRSTHLFLREEEEKIVRVREAVRQWTAEERQRLFDDYFGPWPGICPVCGHEVCMVMSNLGRTVSLLLTCDGCGNKSSVSGALPLEGPVHRTDTGHAA